MRIYRSKKNPYKLIIEINLARLVLLSAAGLLLFLLFLSVRGCSRRHTAAVEDPDAVEVLDSLPPGRAIPYCCRKMSYRTVFGDTNDLHLDAAKTHGLSAVPESRAELDRGKSGLVEISSNRWYTLRDLTHSSPYLTQAAADGLMSIAKAFRDSLSAHDLPQYRVMVTSVLRTKEDVRRLRRSGNVNAAEESAHSFGTTYDISYVRYDKVQPGGDYMEPYDLTKILGQVLQAQRDAGAVYVKYEVRQHCFHITSRL